MADAAITKVENAIVARLSGWAFFAGYTIVADPSTDIALEEGADDTLLISTVGYSFDVADENWKTIHTATVEVESVKQGQTIGTINRANREVMAQIVAAIASDRTFGGMLQDIQEIDVAPSDANGKGVSAASMQLRVQFFTSRDDHFTILGLGTQTF